MIITCTSCQTRFRVADDRIGPKGARVRCSRCQALFVVRHEDGAPETPPPSLPPPLAGRPAPPPPPGTGALEFELTSDPFAVPKSAPVPRDDPFAPRAVPPPLPRPAGAGAAVHDLGSAASLEFPPEGTREFPAAPSLGFPALDGAAPGNPPPEAALPAPYPGEAVLSDLFAARPPETDPFAAAPSEGSGGIALEPADPRSPGRMAQAPGATAEAADLAADFRTPGPSGLEVDAPPEPPPERAPPLSPPAPPPPPPPEAARPAARPAAPAPAPAPAIDEAPAPVRRQAAAVLVNSLSLLLLLVLAAAIFVYWKGGGTAALRSAVGLPAAAPPFTARDLSTGLYDTARGKPVLFVRGRVTARAAAGPLRIRVELLDGTREVARAEGLAGAVATPEELWGSDPARARELRAAVAARAAPRIGAGESLPFLVVFWDYPADLRGLDVKVVAEPAPPG